MTMTTSKMMVPAWCVKVVPEHKTATMEAEQIDVNLPEWATAMTRGAHWSLKLTVWASVAKPKRSRTRSQYYNLYELSA